MKRNYTQPFDTEPHNVFLLIENTRDHTFALVRREGAQGDEDSYWLPRIDMRAKANVPAELIKAAREYGISLESYREVSKKTILFYSFIDKTRGSTLDVFCLHLLGDPIHEAELDDIAFVDIHKVVKLLQETYNNSDFILSAIKKLAAEDVRAAIR